MTAQNNRPQAPESVRTEDALESSQKPAGGPINAAATQDSGSTPDPSNAIAPVNDDLRPVVVNSEHGAPAPAAAPDSIMDTEQDNYARKRGYRNIDELLDSRRR